MSKSSGFAAAPALLHIVINHPLLFDNRGPFRQPGLNHAPDCRPVFQQALRNCRFQPQIFEFIKSL